jgi:hypothetical protein
MERTLRLLFRRDLSRDRQNERVQFEGYNVLWPEGQPVAIGVDAFCKQGQRLLGLGKYLHGHNERQIELVCFPLHDVEDQLTRLPGHRVRRFYMERHGQRGQLHFMDGTPTTILLEIGVDDRRIIDLFGIAEQRDGSRQWLDLAARMVDDSVPVGLPSTPLPQETRL